MAVKRVFAGYYKRYDGKRIYVVRVVKDIDTGDAVVICKDASFIREGNEEYYTIHLESFCEQVNVDGRNMSNEKCTEGRVSGGLMCH